MTYWVFIAGISALGIGGGIYRLAAVAYAAEIFGQRRGVVLGTLTASSNAGGVISAGLVLLIVGGEAVADDFPSAARHSGPEPALDSLVRHGTIPALDRSAEDSGHWNEASSYATDPAHRNHLLSLRVCLAGDS
jgi:hypothetical protein